jgi:hypothetical protein
LEGVTELEGVPVLEGVTDGVPVEDGVPVLEGVPVTELVDVRLDVLVCMIDVVNEGRTLIDPDALFVSRTDAVACPEDEKAFVSVCT